MGESTATELPTSTVLIKDGKVMRVEKWIMWNGQPYHAMTLTRIVAADGSESFRFEGGDPECEDKSDEGTLTKVLSGLHPKIIQQYTALMELQNPTAEIIKETEGFERYMTINF